MSEGRKVVGATGMVVAKNVQRIREKRNLTKPELARRVMGIQQREVVDGLAVTPSRINALALTRIEAGERRVDADDLVLLALALEVSVPTLLMPYGAGPFKLDSPLGEVFAGTYWGWLTSRLPIWAAPGGEMPSDEEVQKAREFFNDSLPAWHSDVDKVPSRGANSLWLKDS